MDDVVTRVESRGVGIARFAISSVFVVDQRRSFTVRPLWSHVSPFQNFRPAFRANSCAQFRGDDDEFVFGRARISARSGR
jgi:hypothetical protein